MTVDFPEVDKDNAVYPISTNSGFSARQTEDHVHYGSSTTASTQMVTGYLLALIKEH